MTRLENQWRVGVAVFAERAEQSRVIRLRHKFLVEDFIQIHCVIAVQDPPPAGLPVRLSCASCRNAAPVGMFQTFHGEAVGVGASDPSVIVRLTFLAGVLRSIDPERSFPIDKPRRPLERHLLNLSAERFERQVAFNSAFGIRRQRL